ncbi:hypothetical protein D3C87_803260 [compost metagenome]
MDFKLLALRPLKNCNERFRKNLIEGKIYKFYEDYKFYNGNTELTEVDFHDVTNIEYQTTNPVPEDLYGSNINISAIVGKNGSGKSALIELFTACINQLSLNLAEDNQLHTTADLLSAVKDEEEKKIRCEIFYKCDNTYFQLKIDDVNFEFKNYSNVDTFTLSNFFYTEIINYSLYAFNSQVVGDWIDNLFHKNDSYQIPLVINPKREGKEHKWQSGTININNEKILLEQRLLVNLLRPVIDNNVSFREIGENKKVTKLLIDDQDIRDFFIYSNDQGQWGKKYETNEEKSNFYQYIKGNHNIDVSVNFDVYNQTLPLLSCHNIPEILNKIKIYYKIIDIGDENLQMKIDYYLIYKVISICDKYLEYDQFVTSKNIVEQGGKEYTRYFIDIDNFLIFIEKNKSHITNKFFQTINFNLHFNDGWQEVVRNNKTDVDTISKLLENLVKNFPKENLQLIEILPPPIFKTTIFLNDLDYIDENDDNLIELNKLSSGEQQLIYSVSSITYHLLNINSVVSGEKTAKYRYVNLIFDEIELYFHPEFQRKFVNYLLNQIGNSQLTNIDGLNILLITHSPFILSDIPKQNVLFLKEGKPDQYINKSTFSANITDLLSESFFIGDTLLGEFVDEKIKKVITYLNNQKREEKEFIKGVISLIDEPLIKYKLDEMYYNSFPEELDIDEEIKKMKQLADKYNFKIEPQL